MYVYVYMYVYICMCICTRTCMYRVLTFSDFIRILDGVYVRGGAGVCGCLRSRVCVCVCVCVGGGGVCVCVCVCICVYVYVYMYVYMCMCMCMCTRTCMFRVLTFSDFIRILDGGLNILRRYQININVLPSVLTDQLILVESIKIN